MGTKYTDTEIYLSEVYYARKRLRDHERDIKDLEATRDDAYQPSRTGSQEVVTQHTKKRYSEVETTVIKLVDGVRPNIEAIQNKISGEEAIIADRMRMVEAAGLVGDELYYIDKRYFQDWSVWKIEKEMPCTHSERLRSTALQKIESVRKKAL